MKLDLKWRDINPVLIKQIVIISKRIAAAPESVTERRVAPRNIVKQNADKYRDALLGLGQWIRRGPY